MKIFHRRGKAQMLSLILILMRDLPSDAESDFDTDDERLTI
jgi:hypothetical protein